ncbi:Flp family type IVb pilin [Paraburkholderia flava]|uniref:Flp family type IVb pilin n=1 Tax=Paraburkholderia flava TaxID=2547393 RepID=UPI00106025D6|nr:Flp family type IVb pilin [Paraburkholderia flava]
MKKFITTFLRDNNGVTAIEYGLLAGLIAVVLVSSISGVEKALSTTFSSIVNALTPTSAGGGS